MTNDSNSASGAAPAVLATRDPSLTEAVQATALALGAELHVVTETDELRRAWPTASLRLVGADMAERAELFTPLGRTYVVGGRASDGLVEASARLRAPVLALPGASAELAAVLASGSGRDDGVVVTVVGGSGGLGVSSLVVALAARAAAAGRRCAAVELAECGGGLDLLFGAETRGGLRWDGLLQARGQLGDLSEHLLSSDGVAVLPLGRDSSAHPDGAAVSAVLGALVRSHAVVFVDGGRGNVPPPGIADGSRDQQVLVVGADVTSVAASRTAAERHGLTSARLVVRTGPGRMLPPESVAEALGLELLGTIRHDPSVPELAACGGSVASRRARRFRADTRAVWEAMGA